jgi:hypothetical protein
VFHDASCGAGVAPPSRPAWLTRLTLITCAGRWNGRDYSHRLVVDAVPEAR